MEEEKKYTKDEAHRLFGATFNNRIFPLVEQESLNEDEKEELIACAHAAYLHWVNFSGCKNVNKQRALYMLAKAYTRVEHKELSKHYAHKCFQFTQDFKSEMQDFDLAYAEEIMARSAALQGDKQLFEKHYQNTLAAEKQIKNKEDLKWFSQDFNGGNWYGIK